MKKALPLLYCFTSTNKLALKTCVNRSAWKLRNGRKEGETLTFAYVPGKGTTLRIGDKDLGAFEGKGFADAVFSIWLGPKPPSEELKKGMLGG